MRLPSNVRPRRRGRWCALALALVLVMLTDPAGSQEPPAVDDSPAVVIAPADPDAPNGGLWFALAGEPGDEVAGVAELHNVGDTEQTVALVLADLTIDEDGEVRLGNDGAGVGAWGAFDEPTRTLGPRASALATFRLTIPADADPGDHIGAVVVETTPAASTGLQVVKRLARRLYVTVPGDATTGVEVVSVDAKVKGGMLPRHADIVVVVENTGNVRLDTTVVVDGEVADGSEVVMSRSTERYRVRRPVPVYGGKRTFRATVSTRTSTGAGPTAEGSTRAWAYPWWVLLALFLVVLLVLSMRELRRRLR